MKACLKGQYTDSMTLRQHLVQFVPSSPITLVQQFMAICCEVDQFPANRWETNTMKQEQII